MTAGILARLGIDMGLVDEKGEDVHVSRVCKACFELGAVSQARVSQEVQHFYSRHEGLKYPDLCRLPHLIDEAMPKPRTLIWVNRKLGGVADCIERKFSAPYSALHTVTEIIAAKPALFALFDIVFEFSYEEMCQYPDGVIAELVAELGLSKPIDEAVAWVARPRKPK
ncbi:MAG: hypothetical protein COA69_09645 [Robiginitomaculum sp.]|nr:MAG: hypothetical protein COA69_09645 [Robiginitomaculum sp.]